MNRIAERFARLKKEGKKGFIVYIGAGDPNLEATQKLALAFDHLGVDVLELAVADSHRSLHLFQSHAPAWIGKIYK
jgi:tryptophan synthase alpha subunit